MRRGLDGIGGSLLGSKLGFGFLAYPSAVGELAVSSIVVTPDPSLATTSVQNLDHEVTIAATGTHTHVSMRVRVVYPSGASGELGPSDVDAGVFSSTGWSVVFDPSFRIWEAMYTAAGPLTEGEYSVQFHSDAGDVAGSMFTSVESLSSDQDPDGLDGVEPEETEILLGEFDALVVTPVNGGTVAIDYGTDPLIIVVQASALGGTHTNASVTVQVTDNYGGSGIANLTTPSPNGFSESGWTDIGGGVFENTYTRASVPEDTYSILINVEFDPSANSPHVLISTSNVPPFTDQAEGFGNDVNVNTNPA